MKRKLAFHAFLSQEQLLNSEILILIGLALGRVLLQVFTNGQYGFHRDELGILDAARDLAWGYVAYPPFTPFIMRVALEIFGPSLNGVRFFSVLVQGIIMLLAGLMARGLGGRFWAQLLAALAVGFSPISISAATVLQYVTFDQLWWALAACLVIYLIRTEDPRYWLGIGAAIGMGVLTKYTIAYCVAGIVGGTLLSRNRRYLLSPWLWGGVGLALLIALPNLLWQVQHGWISLDFLRSIHARDVAAGKADRFFFDQLLSISNPVLLFLCLAGLYFYFFSSTGKRYQLIGWMYLIPLVLFVISRGRGYYLAPAYAMLVAGGAVWWDNRLCTLSGDRAQSWRRTTWRTWGIGTLIIIAATIPLAPVGSQWWKLLTAINGNYVEEIGWPEFVQTVAKIYDAVPAAEKPATTILVGNCGEAGAINLYGPAYHLPKPISGFNSYWQDGYGNPPPETVILVGFPISFQKNFESCEWAGRVTNPYNIPNEETADHPSIFLCRHLRHSWPDFWAHFQYFG